jgi:hypothetical protein
LKSLTTFVGGRGPRFWYSLGPEPQQLNYGQIVIEITNKRDMPLQRDASACALGRDSRRDR